MVKFSQRSQGRWERAVEQSERGAAVAKFVKVASLAGEACFFKFCLKRNAACIACNFPLCDCCDDDDDYDCEAAVTFPLREFAVPWLRQSSNAVRGMELGCRGRR